MKTWKIGTLSIRETSSWEKCYGYAIRKAKSTGNILRINLKDTNTGEIKNVHAFVYFSWSYNDSIFFDTSGEITKFTDEYEDNPDEGKLRYFPDGTIF